MLLGLLALTTAALFAGAAIYINIAEHPARMATEFSPSLVQWSHSYPRGYAMQASLAAASTLLGLGAGWLLGDLRWLVGAALIGANWPYTLRIIMPVNRQLQAIEPQQASATSDALLRRWALLHAGRSLLGLFAVAAYLWALA
jgi:predicted DCC family thiol-disulfide oxidoreductase YuxK